MQDFRSIPPEEFTFKPFQAIGKDWLLIGAERPDGSANAMTASWGGVGVLWNKPVAFIFIRPQRFTRELVDAQATFSLNFLGDEYREQYNLCGSRSGRDMDKVAACGFEVQRQTDTPYFAQSHTVLLCNKLYRQPFDPDQIPPTVRESLYPASDYHALYIGEITDILAR